MSDYLKREMERIPAKSVIKLRNIKILKISHVYTIFLSFISHLLLNQCYK